MLTIIILMGSYLWSAFLMQYFFARTLGERFASKVTFWGTVIMWVIQCLTKLFPMLIWGAEIVVYCNVILIIFSMIYVGVLYKKSFGVRMLAFIVLYVVQGVMDMIGMNIVGMILGYHAVMELDANYMVTVVCVSMPLVSLGTICLKKIWKLTERVDWKLGNTQWLCLILPVSQYVVMWKIAMRYSVQFQSVPLEAVLGTVLALLGDVYMFVLFYRSNKRDHAEKELNGLKHQQELERVRYEQLKESQEEMAKMRHDFQNYVLTLKQME